MFHLFSQCRRDFVVTPLDHPPPPDHSEPSVFVVFPYTIITHELHFDGFPVLWMMEYDISFFIIKFPFPSSAIANTIIISHQYVCFAPHNDIRRNIKVVLSHQLYICVCSARPTESGSSFTSTINGTLPPPVPILWLRVWHISSSMIRSLESFGWCSSIMYFNYAYPP